MTSGSAKSSPASGRARIKDKRATFISDYFTPPPVLQPHISTFYLMRCEDERIRDIHPSNLAHLVLPVRGEGRVSFPGGIADPIAPLSLYTPCSRAAVYEVRGPFHVICAVLTPLGWGSLAQLDASVHGNRVYDAAEWIAPEFRPLAEEWRHGYRSGRLSTGAIVDHLGQAIARHLRPVNAKHVQFIRHVVNWLVGPEAPDIVSLIAATGYSARQVQRLTERYFGLPPRALWRKSRAIRAAAVLSNPKASARALAAVMDYYYDQPHMIREIRQFMGRTPSQLAEDRSPILNQWLQMRNLRRIAPWGRHPDAD